MSDDDRVTWRDLNALRKELLDQIEASARPGRMAYNGLLRFLGAMALGSFLAGVGIPIWLALYGSG